MLVNILLWIILGALAGWIASKVMNRDAQMGATANIVVGILGALIGGFIFNVLGLSSGGGFNLYTLLVATIGAIVLLFLAGLLQKAA